jgi:MoaA/NifB/PqqE/SkfB family radical SAM enzyme
MDVDAITVSMDSHRREAHDEFRGARGTYDSVLAGLEAVMSLRRKRSPRLVVKAALSPDNFNVLCDYVSFFSRRADTVEFQPVQNNFSHQVKDMKVLFKPGHEKQCRDAIFELINTFPQFDSPYYRGMVDFIFQPQELLKSGRFKCLFPSAMILGIDPYGNAGGCLGRNLIGGNLREKPLTEIWRSEKNFDGQKQMRCNSEPCICWHNGIQLNGYLVPLYNMFRG